jgi:hypothetical protein
MPTATYELIQSYVLPSPGYFTFSSIPQNYKHLVLVTMMGRNISGGSGGRGAWITFNGDSGSNYRQFYTYGTGGSSTIQPDVSSQTTPPGVLSSGDTNASYNPNIVEINNYSRADQKKLYLFEGGNGVNGGASGATPNARGGVFWNSTAAITSFTIVQATDTFSTGSSAYLYGIAGDL